MLRKLLLAGVGLLVSLVGAGLAVFGPMMMGSLEMVDGQELGAGRARLIKDGYVAVYLLPIDAQAVALVDCGNDPAGVGVPEFVLSRPLKFLPS